MPCSQQSSPWAGGLGRDPWTGTRTPWRSTPGEGEGDDGDDGDDDDNDDECARWMEKFGADTQRPQRNTDLSHLIFVPHRSGK